MKDVLKILERDARISVSRIATMTGRPEDEVRKIIEDAEKSGIIRRYKTVIDWEKAGSERVFAFIDVKVSPARGVGFDDVAERIYRFPEVHSVYLVSGTYDLRVVIEGETMKQVAFFVAEKLSTIDRVQSTSTHFLLKKYKEDTDIFEEPGEDRRLAVSP
ncbi:MAG: Lrp/AsnC family transcriptional regulator [Armatimonadota bacterium]|nr:Lrp/AsnC family transcriptional regulator [Armatimonadota bacterium]